MYIYRTYFKLTACVIDFDAAYRYLEEDDMTVYLKEDDRISEQTKNKINSINWILKDEDSGYIELQSKESLSANELKAISEWVTGQNADGLGEGFEQQDFANYVDSGLEGFDGEDWDDEWVMASFDWQTNEYIFEFIRRE